MAKGFTTTIRLPAELRDQFDRQYVRGVSAGERRSLNSVIAEALRVYMDGDSATAQGAHDFLSLAQQFWSECPPGDHASVEGLMRLLLEKARALRAAEGHRRAPSEE